MGHFSIRDIIKSAWHNVSGTKWPIWAVLLVIVLIGAGAALLTGLLLSLFGLRPDQLGSNSTNAYLLVLLIELITLMITAPLTAGAQMTALKKARHETISASSGFHYWHRWLPLGLSLVYFSLGLFVINFIVGYVTATTPDSAFAILISLFAMIALLLYYTFFLFNLLAVADQNKGPFAALLYSARAVSHHWFKVLCLWVFGGLVFMIAALPFGLGLLCPYTWVKASTAVITGILTIWALPYCHLILATAYHKLSDS